MNFRELLSDVFIKSYETSEIIGRCIYSTHTNYVYKQINIVLRRESRGERKKEMGAIGSSVTLNKTKQNRHNCWCFDLSIFYLTRINTGRKIPSPISSNLACETISLLACHASWHIIKLPIFSITVHNIHIGTDLFYHNIIYDAHSYNHSSRKPLSAQVV